MTRKAYPIIFNLFLLTVVIYLGVDLFYGVLEGHMHQYDILSPSHPVPSAGVKADPSKRVPLDGYEVITRRNLFGSLDSPSPVKKKTALKQAEIEALEPTSLNISLLGTVTHLNGSGWAVIEERGKREQGLYRVGDPIQDAVIVNILRGRVVLRKGDEDQILVMETLETSSKQDVPASPGPGGAESTITVGRADVTDSLKNINKLLTQVRIRPHLHNGKPDGFMLSYISRGSIFSRLGLQRGDIIKQLNGAPINTPEDAFSFYKALESGSDLSLDIVRKGEPKTINYSIR